MLPSGFEPESKPREGLMIGHYTTGAGKPFNHHWSLQVS
jgi:hypothetical protein